MSFYNSQEAILFWRTTLCTVVSSSGTSPPFDGLQNCRPWIKENITWPQDSQFRSWYACLSFICYLYYIYIYFFLIFFWIELSRIFVTKDQIQIDTYVMNEILLIYRFLSIFPLNLLSLSSSSSSFIIIIIIIFFFFFFSFFSSSRWKENILSLKLKFLRSRYQTQKKTKVLVLALFLIIFIVFFFVYIINSLIYRFEVYIYIYILDYWPTTYYLSGCFVLELLSTGYIKMWSSSFLRLRHGERQFRGIQIFSLLLFILFHGYSLRFARDFCH